MRRLVWQVIGAILFLWFALLLGMVSESNYSLEYRWFEVPQRLLQGLSYGAEAAKPEPKVLSEADALKLENLQLRKSVLQSQGQTLQVQADVVTRGLQQVDKDRAKFLEELRKRYDITEKWEINLDERKIFPPKEEPKK